MVTQRLDARPVNHDEWSAWPETNLPVEVVDGWPIVSPAPAGRHQRILSRLLLVLAAAVPDDFEMIVGPYDWVLRRAPLLVRQPDLMVINRAPEPPPCLYEPPLVALEILSPTSRERDLVHKRRQYAEAGLPWYWLVDPDVPQILALRNADGAFVQHSSAVGDDVLCLTQPFPLELAPATLL